MFAKHTHLLTKPKSYDYMTPTGPNMTYRTLHDPTGSYRTLNQPKPTIRPTGPSKNRTLQDPRRCKSATPDGRLIEERCLVSVVEHVQLVAIFAPKGLFVFAILTDMPPKTDVCSSKSVNFCLFLIKFVSSCHNLIQKYFEFSCQIKN